MVNAIILMSCERDQIARIGETLAGMDEIAEVYSVAGKFDLVAIVRVAHNDDLARLVTHHMTGIDGITSTETLFAFKAYSRHDLEALFSVGL
ncbi:MAG: Lrp/AsnC ligand binding domain-containing protein [Pseudomonadota bacterium]